jgi:hypothetical protein
MEAAKIFFANTRKQLFKSTYFRMNYLSKPITGFLLLTGQLFQDGSQFQLILRSPETIGNNNFNIF